MKINHQTRVGVKLSFQRLQKTFPNNDLFLKLGHSIDHMIGLVKEDTTRNQIYPESTLFQMQLYFECRKNATKSFDWSATVVERSLF